MKWLIQRLLAGCATKVPTTQAVEIPVYSPFVKAVPARPEHEFNKLTPDASEGEKVIAFARDWLRGRKYEGEHETVIAGCR
jgi:hypothetical protein